MSGPERGLYEVLVTAALESRLQELDDRLVVTREALRPAEAADRIALHLSRIVRRALDSVDDDDRVAASVALARTLLAQIDAAIAGVSATLDSPLAGCGESLSNDRSALRRSTARASPPALVGAMLAADPSPRRPHHVASSRLRIRTRL